ncbi:MAG: InlB B-repeat-containing protein [Paludibacteraceae bacterium]|nr:InlB B-repeat-containing protein [Paludibacteraceae bacterium]
MKNKIRFLAMMLIGVLLSVNQVWGADTFTKVTSEPDDWSGEYLLIYEVNATSGLAWTGVDAGQCHVDATISSGSIEGVPSGAVTLTIAKMTGGYSIKVNGGTNNGKYIGKSTNANGMDISASAVVNTLEWDGDEDVVITAAGGCTMRYNNTSGSTNERFRYYKSGQQKVELYKKAASITYTDYLTDCAVPYNVTANLTNVTASPTIPATIEAGGTFSTTISANSGYSLPDDITVIGGTKSWNKNTGALSITNVTGDVSITITAVANDEYYYHGTQNSWGATKMTRSADGLYWYISATKGGSNHEFKLTKGSGYTTEYSYSYNSAGFNCSNVTNMNNSDKTWSTSNCAIYENTNNYYILFYLPNTIINSSSDPKICASTSLPETAMSMAAGNKVYFDNSVFGVTPYFRRGRTCHNLATNMSLVPGTANLYTVTTTAYDNYVAYAIANKEGWAGDNSIYKVNTGDGHAITKSTNYIKETIDGDITIVPSTTSGTDQGCTYYNYNKTAGMLTHTATITTPSNGTITVAYTDVDNISKNFTSGNRDLAHTCNLTITATPNTGYQLTSLTVNGEAFTSGNVHKLSADATIAATFSVAQYSLSVANVADVEITATADGGSAIAEGSNANVDYNKTVTLNYSNLTDGKGLTWKVYKTGDESTTVSVSGTGNDATFTMPAYPVTVAATIADLPTWTITLNTGSGTLASGTTEIVVVQGQSTTLPSCEIDCEDSYGEWQFAGWKTGSNVGTITTTAPAFVETNYTPSSDITLYAVYKAVDASGGSEDVENKVGMLGNVISGTWSGTGNYSAMGGKYCTNTAPDGATKIKSIYVLERSNWTSGAKLTITNNTKSTTVGTIIGGTGTIYPNVAVSPGDAIRFTGESGKTVNFSGITVTYVVTSSITHYWSIPCNEKYTMTFHGVGGDASTIDWTGSLGSEDDYMELNATTITAYPTCATAETGWTFLGWRTTDYNSGKEVDDENASTDDPGVASIYKNGKGFALNSGTTSPCGDDVRCVDMYPVFTKFVENDKPEIATLASGSKYYMYYTSDAAGYQDDYSSLDGQTTRIYAHTFSSASFNSTTACASAQLFEFTKRADGNWDIRMRNAADNGYESHSYIYTVADNTDLYTQAAQPSYGWVIEAVTIGGKTMVKMQYAGNTNPKRFMKVYDGGGSSASGTFKNYSEDCEGSTQYHAIYLGSCSNRIFSSNPGHAATWEVYGDFTDDGTANFVGYPMTNGMLVVPNLAANTTYQFKLRKTTDGTNYTWFGDANEHNTYTTSGVEWTLDGSAGGHNVNLVTGAAGSYTFTASHMSAEYPGITVTYPTAYTITYAGGDGASGSMSPTINIAAGENVALPTPTFTKDNWNCIGWTADVNVTVNSATVTAGSFIPKTATIQDINNNITLTAVWEQLIITQADELYEVVVGGTLQLTLTAYYSPNITTGALYTWATNNINYATVSNTGLVTGHQAVNSGEYVVVTSSFGTESNHYTIVVKSAACEQWGLHYWNTESGTFGDLCFSQVGETDEWRTDQEHLFILPSNSSADKLILLYGGVNSAHADEWAFRWVPTIASQAGGCGENDGNHYSGQDAIGYFRIFANSTDKNSYLGFQPVYSAAFGRDGEDWQIKDFANTGNAGYHGHEYATDINDMIEVPEGYDTDVKLYVGTKNSHGTVNQVYERSNMRLMSNVPELNGTGHAHEFGRLYIHPTDACNNANNYDVHFVRYYRLHYNLVGGAGTGDYTDKFVLPDASASDRTFTLETAPTKDGFTFRGWSVSIGGSEATTKQPSESVILTDDAVATAIWAQNFTVTYEIGGYSSSCSGSTTHYCGEENITVCDNLVVPTGFTFNGWTSNVEIGGKTSFQGGNKFTMPCSNVIFTSNVTADEYHITYNGLEGATHSNPPTYTVEREFTFADPSARTGYSFVGWFDAATDGNQVTGIVLGSTGDVTVWAYWNAKQINVTLKANYTDGTDGSVNFTYGTSTKSAYTAVSNKFGYTLLGYYTTAEGGNKILNANGDIDGPNKSGWIDADGNWIRTTADSKLYAHWSAITGIDYYVYHYKMNADGTYPSEPTAQTSGKGKTDEVKTNLEPNVYEGFVTPEHQDLTIVYGGENILRYYYERNKYELTWNFGGGTPAGEYTQGQVYHGATITYPTSVSKDGYCFMGWDITPTTMPMAATTITAQWAAYENYRTYCGNAVTFVANGGMGDDYVVTVDAEKLTNIPTVETAGFTREGYGFAGWMVNGDESKTVYAPGATINPITDGMIVNAVWISNPTINEAIPVITSTNNMAIASTPRTLTVANPDGLEATIRIAYKKDGVAVEATNSEFRFCNTSGTISESNIVSSATSIATDFTIQYKPNAYNKIDDDYTLYITVTRKGSSAIVSSAEFNLKGRSLPEKFVIAVKNSSEQWLALPANMTGACTPEGMPITVTGEGLEMTADASLAAAYSLTGHSFAKDSVFFKSAYNSKELWASKSSSEINNGGTATSDNKLNYEWGLTPTDETLISYNMANKQNGKQLKYYDNSKFGMYASGEGTIYFIAVTPKEETTAVVDEWYQNKILFHLPFAMKSVSMTINGVAVPDADITIAERKIKTTGYVLYELGGDIDLVAASGQVMELIIGDGTTEYAANISIPQIIVGEVANCSALPAKADVVVRDGGHLTIDVEGAMAKSFNNVTIYPNSKISVPDGKYFNVKSLTFFGGIDEWYDTEESEYVETNIYAPELSLKGTMKADTLIYRMRVNAEHMMPVSFPYDVTINKIVREDKLDSPSWGKVGTDIRLETYNGELRAAGNRRESDESTWTEIKDGTLTAGIGYTVAAQNRFKNYPYTILDFPMANPYKSVAAEEAVKNAAVQAHDAVNWYDKGWNLMGNPYMAGITGAGAIKVNETGYDFVYIPTADGEDYYQGPIATARILPFMDFFVQVNEGGTMYFDLTKRVDAPARMLADIERTAQFSIGLAGANKTDITYFKVADNFTESYNIPGDNAKMFGSAVNTKVYSLLNGEDQLAQMALNADMTAQPIQLGYIAPENGEYIFALDNTYTDYQNVEHIYLLENGEIKVDLLNAQYTFTTEAKTEDERFAILIVMKGAKMPTDLMDGLFDNDVASPKKVIYDDHFYILNTNRRVYDGTGKYINKMQKNK